jgi:ABC-type multidrug transport system fused ATPase/permease subunit
LLPDASVECKAFGHTFGCLGWTGGWLAAYAGRAEVPVIEVRNLTKRYGDKAAVDDLSFVVRPGLVTGFLGRTDLGKRS